MSESDAILDILGLGVASVDDLLLVEQFPERNKKFPVRSMTRQGGGLTATALVAASRLGCRNHFVIKLGKDDLSVFLRESLRREGLVLHEQPGSPEQRPCHAFVITEKDTGDRTILWNSENLYSIDIGPKEMELVARARCLFVDCVPIAGITQAVRAARERGIPVVGDFENAAPELLALIHLVDHPILPLLAAIQLTGESKPEAAIQAMLREPGREFACATDSERGCWWAERSDPERVFHQPAFRIEKVVDSCGCGDVFHGAYAAALVQGYPAAERVRRASAAAALKAGKAGSQLGAPTLAELEAFLGAGPRHW